MPELTSEDKVVLLLRTLPPEAAEALLGRLPPSRAARVREKMQAASDSPPEVVKQASQEFFDVLRIAERSLSDLAEAPVTPSDLLDTPPQPAEPAPPPAEEAPPADPVAALRECPPEAVAAALKGERPAAVALVVGCLEVPQATAVLKLLPPDVRHEAAVRLGLPTGLRPELAQRILQAVLARCKEYAAKPAEPSGDQLLVRMADLVRGLGREDRKEILARLEKSDPETAEKVRRKLYTFADLLRLDDRTVQGILGDFSTQTLALALKGASEEIKVKVLTNVSKRAKETIGEEMELLASASAAMVEDAQNQFVQTLQALDAEGKISL